MAKRSIATPSAASKVLVVLLIVVGTGLIMSLGASAFGAFGSPAEQLRIDEDTYQAVHLSDGRVLFGQLDVIDRHNLSLNNVYYVEDTSEDLKVNEATLVKHETKPYGPEGSVVINRDQVLFWENLKDTGLVTETIMNNSEDGDEN